MRHLRSICGTGLALLAAAVLGWGCGGSRSEPTRVETGALRLVASLEPAAARVGSNHLWISLEDGAGQPLPGAELRVKVHMVAMGAMPPMGGAASVEELEAGRYRADFELDMGGTWIVEIDAAPPAGPAQRIEGSLTVGSPGLRLRAEGGGAAGAPAEASAHAGHAPAERHPAEFAVDPARLQTVGVRTTPVERTDVGVDVRTVGRVVFDETRLEDVSPKVRGWIEELRADAVGVRVERGDVLFTLYSPDLYAAQQELLQALRSEGALSGSLARAAENRLRLWGVSRADIERIAQRGEPLDALPVRAPTSGFVIEKNVVEGSSVTPGQRLMRIAPLDRVWIEIDLYEEDMRTVRVGQLAAITLSHLPGRTYTGTVTFLYPFLSSGTRTARARIELDNPGLVLLPDMFANVELGSEARQALVVPEGAVLYAGDRKFVFVALGGGRFRPQAVEVGVRKGEQIEIVSGLRGDEQVVSSGTFLIASESRLRAALEQW